MWQFRSQFCGATKYCTAEIPFDFLDTDKFMYVEKLQDRSLEVAWTESVSSAEVVQITWNLSLETAIFMTRRDWNLHKYWMDFVKICIYSNKCCFLYILEKKEVLSKWWNCKLYINKLIMPLFRCSDHLQYMRWYVCWFDSFL